MPVVNKQTDNNKRKTVESNWNQLSDPNDDKMNSKKEKKKSITGYDFSFWINQYYLKL